MCSAKIRKVIIRGIKQGKSVKIVTINILSEQLAFEHWPIMTIILMFYVNCMLSAK